MDSAERAGAPATDVTDLLRRWASGDAGAQDRLIPLIYEECRRIAERQLRSEEPGHTLEPTALVHELYLRLVDQRAASWQSRAHFYGVAAQMMRRILVDHARARLTRKRGATRVMISLANVADTASDTSIADILAIDDLLSRLGALDPEQQRIVELRFFAGLTVEETALVIGRSPRTVKREWQLAKAWLYRELRKE
jgi:RNA polymerase sigma factor (TIGR02999 family)